MRPRNVETTTYFVGWPTDGDGDTLFFVDASEEERDQISKWLDERHEDGWIGRVYAETFEAFREASGMNDDEEEDEPADYAGPTVPYTRIDGL